MRRPLLALCMTALLCAAGASSATDDDDAYAPRIRKLGEELRCLVCQNQTIADSQSGLAEDLRREIRVQMVAGKSDKEIVEYLVDRYGDFVRYLPPVKGITLLLWFGPGLAMVLGLVFLLRTLRRRAREQDEVPLNTDERATLTALLGEQPREEKT